MRFPEIRVTRTGSVIERVAWDPCEHGEPLCDITGMRVTKVETEIGADGAAPMVKVTFMARLVEFEKDDRRAEGNDVPQAGIER